MTSKAKTMFLRSILFAVFALAFQQLAQAQEETERPHVPLRHELGVNATTLIGRFFRSDSFPNNTENPYMLTYRMSKGRFGLRLGAGAKHHYDKVSEAGFADYESKQNTRIDARLGLDYAMTLGRRFTGTVGVDFAMNRSVDKAVQDSGFDVIETTDQSVGWGGGPFVGLHFWFNRHFALYTEASFYFMSATTERGRIFKNFPELDDEVTTTESTDLVTQLPTSIFFIYRF